MAAGSEREGGDAHRNHSAGGVMRESSSITRCGCRPMARRLGAGAAETTADTAAASSKAQERAGAIQALVAMPMAEWPVMEQALVTANIADLPAGWPV